MIVNLANIRRFLLDYFNDEELTELCFDHFHEVYRRFASTQTKNAKALLLVEYCNDRNLLPDLLTKLEHARPEPFNLAFGHASDSQAGRVNLNTAGESELMNLPGIGPRLAQAIIYGRPYHSVEELRHVNGFGSRRFTALRNWITI